jgi:hypothetical protein
VYLQWLRFTGGYYNNTRVTWSFAFTDLYGVLATEQGMVATSDIILGVSAPNAAGCSIRAFTSGGEVWSGPFAPFILAIGRIA